MYGYRLLPLTLYGRATRDSYSQHSLKVVTTSATTVVSATHAATTARELLGTPRTKRVLEVEPQTPSFCLLDYSEGEKCYENIVAQEIVCQMVPSTSLSDY